MSKNAVITCSLLAAYVFCAFQIERPVYDSEPLPEVSFGLTSEELAASVSRWNSEPYKYTPATPLPGERGYGQPIIIVDAPQQIVPQYSAPTYRCWTFSLARPDGWWFDSDYPCQSERKARQGFDYW